MRTCLLVLVLAVVPLCSVYAADIPVDAGGIVFDISAGVTWMMVAGGVVAVALIGVYLVISGVRGIIDLVSGAGGRDDETGNYSLHCNESVYVGDVRSVSEKEQRVYHGGE